MTAANPSCDSHAFPGPAASKLAAEPTLEEILAGPIVCALMVADQVDAEALTAMLRSVAVRSGKRTPTPRPAGADLPGLRGGLGGVTGWERKEDDHDRGLQRPVGGSAL